MVLGLDQAPAASQGLLINLNPALSPHLEQFARVIEIVNQEPQLLALCRENFRLYRQKGYDPQRVEL
ncbi:DNA polymerase III subunit chi [compost metagenome]